MGRERDRNRWKSLKRSKTIFLSLSLVYLFEFKLGLRESLIFGLPPNELRQIAKTLLRRKGSVLFCYFYFSAETRKDLRFLFFFCFVLFGFFSSFRFVLLDAFRGTVIKLSEGFCRRELKRHE